MLGVTDSSSINSALLGSSDANTAADGSTAVSNADGSLTVTSSDGDVIATHSDPLPVVAIPVTVMPEAVEVAIVTPALTEEGVAHGIWSADIESAGDWTAQKVELGRAIIDIDSVYRLSINDILAEVLLENRTTNVVTRIWGDAQVSVNGNDVGQFWGTSSFQLSNGTLITASTVVSPNNSAAYMLDKLVVTRNEYGFVVTGISSETVGDVNIALAANASVYDHVQAPVTATSPAVTPTVDTIADANVPVETVTEAPTTDGSALTVSHLAETLDESAPVESAPLSANETMEASLPTRPPIASSTIAEEAPATAAPILVENITANIAAEKAKVDGYDMDDDQRDGLVFVETANGWLDEWDDQAISAAVLAQTMPGDLFGPNSDIMSRGEFNTVINRFISIMNTQRFMSQISSANSASQSQLRDIAADQNRTSADKQAELRAARERLIMIGLMEAGSIATELLDRYRGVGQPIANAA